MENKEFIASQTKHGITVNKKLIQGYGPIPALFIALLILNMDADGWTRLSLMQISNQIGTPISKINYYRKMLVHFKFLEIRKKGMPATFQYKIDIDRIYDVII